MPFARREPAPEEALVRQRLEQLLGGGSGHGWTDDGARAPASGRQRLEPDEPTEVTGGRWRPHRATLEARTDPEELLGAPSTDLPDTGRHRTSGRPPLFSLPESLRGAQVAVNPAAVLGMLLVVLLVAVVLGWRVWSSGRAAVPRPVSPVVATGDGGQVTAAPMASGPASGDGAVVDSAGTGAEGAGAAGDPGGAAPTVLVVHVAGAVLEPGVVELAPGSRVGEAVAAAGGLGPDADTGRINLARPVTDGERIWVPVPGEEEPELPGGGPQAGSGGTGGADGGADTGAVVDLNTADQAALETLPGVGPVTAQRILAWREENGRFSSAEELLEVSGIGERTLEQLRPHLAW